MFDSRDILMVTQKFEAEFDTQLGIQEPLGSVFAETEEKVYLIPNTVSEDDMITLLKHSIDTGTNLLEAAYGGNIFKYDPDCVY